MRRIAFALLIWSLCAPVRGADTVTLGEPRGRFALTVAIEREETRGAAAPAGAGVHFRTRLTYDVTLEPGEAGRIRLQSRIHDLRAESADALTQAAGETEGFLLTGLVSVPLTVDLSTGGAALAISDWQATQTATREAIARRIVEMPARRAEIHPNSPYGGTDLDEIDRKVAAALARAAAEASPTAWLDQVYRESVLLFPLAGETIEIGATIERYTAVPRAAEVVPIEVADRWRLCDRDPAGGRALFDVTLLVGAEEVMRERAAKALAEQGQADGSGSRPRIAVASQATGEAEVEIATGLIRRFIWRWTYRIGTIEAEMVETVTVTDTPAPAPPH